MGTKTVTDFQQMIEFICERPEMYVNERRFKTVAAWLNGYSGGLIHCHNGDKSQIGLSGFQDWLSAKFYASHGIGRNLIWEGYIIRLYPDDNQALEQLPVLFNEFITETRRGDVEIEIKS